VTQPREALAPRPSITQTLQVGGTVAFTLGLGTLALGAPILAVVLFVLSASLVSIGRARARGWTPERVGAGAVLVGAVFLTLAGWAVAGVVGVLIAGLGAWFVWHVGLRQRARQL
jgi:hypothetical protein